MARNAACLCAAVRPEARRTRLRLPHANERATDKASEERASNLHAPRACPYLWPRFAYAEQLRCEERRVRTRTDASCHQVGPAQRGLQCERMRVRRRVLGNRRVGQRE